jgi:hypothetical protein
MSTPAFRCGASRFYMHSRVHGLPAVGRPGEDAGDAAHGSMPDTVRRGNLGGGRGLVGTGP